ncbi:MAG: 3-phosphoshikimate 1-carboxyvinyltransferase [Gammaproteobacteria bacterium]|nr:3-phosphoshikimate 1-carboxyvinyltransferase [Gammaproteobacteria bacterium]
MSNLTLIANPTKTISGTVIVPGDKSISHRAIIFSMLCKGRTKIYNLLESEDVKRTIDVSQSLGSNIITNNQFIDIHGLGIDGISEPKSVLDFGNSGTSLRLFMGILSSQTFTTTLTGDHSLLKRPMERVASPLRLMGANISTNNGKAPVKILPPLGKFHGIDYRLDIPSAQIKSAIILASLFCRNKTILHTDTTTRDHTENMLKLFNYPISTSKNSIEVNPGILESPKIIKVPGDFSSASFFIVAALLSEDSRIIIKNVGLNPTRTGLINILRLMGADIQVDITNKNYEATGDVIVSSSKLMGIKVPNKLISLAIDELPLIFLAAAMASDETIIRNAEELRFKESDRIKSMVDLLKNLSIEVNEYQDGLEIKGGNISGGIINSFGDHRIAMTALVASSIAKEKIEVENCENINTSFPSFITLMNSIGMNIIKKEL